uniref:Uncharacterized protein n=1 Tax=Timema poppense TaxID=170557 RepID=A0A7R9H220_TIMPO|nr:unnamed protein product [Timema poppensis]
MFSPQQDGRWLQQAPIYRTVLKVFVSPELLTHLLSTPTLLLLLSSIDEGTTSGKHLDVLKMDILPRVSVHRSPGGIYSIPIAQKAVKWGLHTQDGNIETKEREGVIIGGEHVTSRPGKDPEQSSGFGNSLACTNCCEHGTIHVESNCYGCLPDSPTACVNKYRLLGLDSTSDYQSIRFSVVLKRQVAVATPTAVLQDVHTTLIIITSSSKTFDPLGSIVSKRVSFLLNYTAEDRKLKNKNTTVKGPINRHAYDFGNAKLPNVPDYWTISV